jgi:uncharacterized repeat protein (TIGR01451 family)
VYPGQAACVNDWTSDPADLGGLVNVMAVRLVSASQYVTGEGLSLGYQMSVPTVSRDQIAWNSVAAFGRTVAGVDLLPTESPKVGITASDDRLSLEKSVDAAHAEAGDTLAYTVTVGNVGTRDSVPTTVSDALPEGVTFVAATAGGAYDPATKVVTWSIPAIARDDVLVLEVTVTVDAQQDDNEILNRATVVNPTGYSLPVVANPCPGDPDASCAVTSVTPSPTALGFTGVRLQRVSLFLAVTAVIAGAVLLIVRRRAAAH